MRMALILGVIGLLAGGLVGYLTKPDVAQIRVPGIELEITAEGNTNDSAVQQHIGISALIGALVGAGAGFAVGRVKG
jgi:hypothetical protein